MNPVHFEGENRKMNEIALMIPGDLSDWGLLVIHGWLEQKAEELATQQNCFYETIKKPHYNQELDTYVMIIKLAEGNKIYESTN
jgi:hypothetical protein